jgi:hypothetical protein
MAPTLRMKVPQDGKLNFQMRLNRNFLFRKFISAYVNRPVANFNCLSRQSDYAIHKLDRLIPGVLKYHDITASNPTNPLD